MSDIIKFFDNSSFKVDLLNGGPHDKVCGGEDEERAGEEEGEVDRRHQEARPRALAESRCYFEPFGVYRQILFIQLRRKCHRV